MTLRILSLNVWGLSEPFSRDLPARMVAIGEAFAALAPDVVALQEVWDSTARATLLAAGRRVGLAHAWHHESALRGSGLVVLSRLPIRAATLHRFELAGIAEAIDEADYLGGKGFVEVVLETPQGPVVLVDTHLQAAYAPRARDPYVSLRVGQAVQLAAHVRGVEHPLVLAGDLNFSDADDEYRVLTGLAGVSDVGAVLGSRQATALASNPYRTGGDDKRIDYLFCRDGRTRRLVPRAVTRVLDRPLEIDGHSAAHSDHAGLLGEFEFERGGADAPQVSDDAAQTARARLLAGRSEVVERQREQRVLAALGLVAAPLAWLASRHPELSRRRLLKTLALGTAAMAGAFGAGRLTLTESLRPSELAGFDAALARLDALSERS